MPTAYLTAPPDEDEDSQSFASGVRADYLSATPADPSGDPSQSAPATPAPSSVAPAGASPVTAPAYTAPDRTNLQNWERQQQTDSQVTPHDASNSPKWWERLAGGLSAGAMAFGKVPGAVEAGQAITNRRYNNAEAQRQGRLAADNSGIAAERANITDANQDFERNLQGFNAQGLADQRNQTAADREAQAQQRAASIAPESLQPDDPSNPLGSWHGTTVAGKPVKLSQPPDAWLKTSAGQSAQREANIKAWNLTPEQATYYRTGWKPPTPKEPRQPSAEEIMLNQATSAWRRDNPGKQQPSLGELGKIIATVRGKSDPDDDDHVSAIVADATQKKQEWADQWKRDDDGSYVGVADPSKRLTPEQFNEKIEQFRTGANTKLAKYGTKIDDHGNVVTGKASPNAPQATAATPAATQPQTRLVRDRSGNQIAVKIVNGKWVNAKTGQPL